MAGRIREGVQDQEGQLAALDDEGPAVISGRQRRAEHTIRARPRGRDIPHPPRRPETIHPRLRIDQLAQPLTDLEERYPLLGYADGVARLGVPALAGVPMPDAEAPEPAQLDLVPLAQSLGDV